MDNINTAPRLEKAALLVKRDAKVVTVFVRASEMFASIPYLGSCRERTNVQVPCALVFLLAHIIFDEVLLSKCRHNC